VNCGPEATCVAEGLNVTEGGSAAEFNCVGDCEIDINNARNSTFEVNCSSGSSCDVDANNVEGTSVEVRCLEGAACCLRCNSTNSATRCEMRCEEGASCDLRCGEDRRCSCTGPGACDQEETDACGGD
jgi:hypothetical protein